MEQIGKAVLILTILYTSFFPFSMYLLCLEYSGLLHLHPSLLSQSIQFISMTHILTFYRLYPHVKVWKIPQMLSSIIDRFPSSREWQEYGVPPRGWGRGTLG